MNNDYVTRPEFKLHQKHMDTKLNMLEKSLKSEIKTAISELKNEINDNKVTTTRFWIGISIPAIIGIVSLVVSIATLLLK